MRKKSGEIINNNRMIILKIKITIITKIKGRNKLNDDHACTHPSRASAEGTPAAAASGMGAGASSGAAASRPVLPQKSEASRIVFCKAVYT